MFTQAKSDETRTRILEAALQLFRQKGFDETTMREIAVQAGMATGAAYYYFSSKEALVMAFYEQAQKDMNPLIDGALAGSRSLEGRVRAILAVKLQYFEQDRKFLGALNRHAADPEHPLSPFSAETREIRTQDMQHFERAIDISRLNVPEDLKTALPRILWLYQMGIILFWIHDRSTRQQRTQQLLDSSLPMVSGLMKLANLPFARPLRKRVLELIRIVAPGEAA